MSVAGKAVDISILKRVVSYLKPYRSTFLFTGILTVLLAFIAPARPLLIQYTLDNYVVRPDADGLALMTVLLVVLILVQAVMEYFQTYWANWLGQSVIKDIRVRLFDHITGFRLKYFDKTPIGTLVTRVVSDIEAIAQIFSEGLLVIIGDLLQLITVIALMFYFSPKLALFSLAPVPLLLISTYIFKNAIKSSFQEVRKQISNLNAFVQEHITGMNIVQIFNREREEYQKFTEINKKHTKAHLRSIMAYSIFLPLVEILAAISVSSLVWWGAGEVVGGTISYGELVAYLLLIYMLFRPIRQLADRFNTLQMGMVSSERVFKVMDTREFIDDEGSEDIEDVKGEIEFKDVWFAYNNEEWVLRDINFKVEAGETLAIVGATGAGKSSMINILSRFYELNKGNILVDGIDIRKFKLPELRTNVAVVLQDVFLFSDSIFNNITLQNESVSRQQVIEAAKIVGAHDFISQLPGDYDYNVRERGAMLSAGQRQLIAFIRAYINNPKILVLDEATSSIDTESERMIQHAITRLTENRTSIVIAHRLATIQNADRIMVLDHGRIVEMGSHQELLQKGGAYKKLYEIQFLES